MAAPGFVRAVGGALAAGARRGLAGGRGRGGGGRGGWSRGIAGAGSAGRDYYDVLGVPRGAGEKDIKRAYRLRAKEFHPDTSDDPRAEEKFQEVQKAYEVLRDTEKRRIYDQVGRERMEQFESGGSGGPGGPFGGPGGGFGGGFGGAGGPFGGGGAGPHGFQNMEDIFQQFFRGGAAGGPGAQPQTPTPDVRVALTLRFKEAVFGCTKNVLFQAPDVCDRCGGQGAEPGTSASTCGSCGGSGREEVRHGLFMVQTTCSACGGQGRVILSPCTSCGGVGTTIRQRTLDVNIPAGVNSGQTLRIRGEGGASGGSAQKGNLILDLEVDEDPVFQREGVDVTVTARVGAVQAALGADVPVPTLDGEDVALRMPPGTQPGERVVMHGRGVPRVNGQGRGDQFVVYEVEVPRPEQLTQRQRKLLREFQALQGDGAEGGEDRAA